jgi:regulator of replication initiation timing
MQRGNRSELKDKCEEMQKDIEKFVAKISTLEVQKAEIVKENQILKSKQTRSTVNNDKIDELTTENGRINSI